MGSHHGDDPHKAAFTSQRRLGPFHETVSDTSEQISCQTPSSLSYRRKRHGFSDVTPDRHRRPSRGRLSGETYTAVPRNTKHYTQMYRRMLSQRFTASFVPSGCRVIQPNSICHTQDTHEKPGMEANEAMKGVLVPGLRIYQQNAFVPR